MDRQFNPGTPVFFQALHGAPLGIWDLAPRTLAAMQALPASESIDCLDKLARKQKISIELDADWRELVAAPLSKEERTRQWIAAHPEFQRCIAEHFKREAGAATLVVVLIWLGALDDWVAASVRSLSTASGGRICKSNVHRAGKMLAEQGLLLLNEGRYFLRADALDAVLAEKTGRRK